MKIILRNKLAIFLILLASLMSFGCMNDMEHQGNWSSPVADEDYLYVPSDSGKIHKFSKLDVYVRDPKNSRDESATEDVLIELIDSWNLDDDILLAQATSPLTRTKDYNKGIKMYSDYDSIVSVVRQKRFIWNDEGYPSNYNLFNRPRRQDFKGYLVENGAFYIGHSEHI